MQVSTWLPFIADLGLGLWGFVGTVLDEPISRDSAKPPPKTPSSPEASFEK